MKSLSFKLWSICLIIAVALPLCYVGTKELKLKLDNKQLVEVIDVKSTTIDKGDYSITTYAFAYRADASASPVWCEMKDYRSVPEVGLAEVVLRNGKCVWYEAIE